MMQRLISYALGLLVLLSLIAGCAAIKSSGKMERFQRDITNYNALIRWGDYQTAAKFLTPEARPTGLVDTRHMKDIRIISYERKLVQFSPDKNTAYVVYRFQFINDYVGRPQQYLDRQKWIYNEKAKAWRLDGPMPRFGKRR